jgi:hypothetical protein
MTPDTPFTVAEYPTETEAVMAMNYLEGHGIKATLAGGAPAKEMGNYYVPLGYMLQVSSDDAERAGRLLEPIMRRRWRRYRASHSGHLPRWLYHVWIAAAVVTAIVFFLSVARLMSLQ